MKRTKTSKGRFEWKFKRSLNREEQIKCFDSFSIILVCHDSVPRRTSGFGSQPKPSELPKVMFTAAWFEGAGGRQGTV